MKSKRQNSIFGFLVLSFEMFLGDAIYGEIGVITDHEIFRLVGLQGKTIVEANIYD